VTRGGEEGSTRTSGHSHGSSQTRGFTSNHGSTDDSLFHHSASTGHSTTRDYGRSQEWSQSDAWSEAANWSHAQNTQRVYEFAIEPTVLQNLPDYALLLPRHGPAGTQVRAVECDPAIVTMTQPYSAIPDGADPAYPAITPGHNDATDSSQPREQPARPTADERPVRPPHTSDWTPDNQPR
jgi:hypothetical protein